MTANFIYHLVIETSLAEDLENSSELKTIWKNLLPENTPLHLDQIHVIKEGSLKKLHLPSTDYIMLLHHQKTPLVSLDLFCFQVAHAPLKVTGFLGFSMTEQVSDQCFFPSQDSRKFFPLKTTTERSHYADALVWGHLFFGLVELALKPIAQRFEAAEYAYHAGHRDRQTRGALFLDRDGVLIEDGRYLFEPDKVVLKEGVVDLIKRARAKNYFVFCLTNQSGIARGYFTEQQMHLCHEKVAELLACEGQGIDAWFFCPYLKDAKVQQYNKHSLLRKPFSGLLLQAATGNPIDIAISLMVGDNLSDQLDLTGLAVYLTQGHYSLDGATSKIVKQFSEIQL